MEVALVVAGIVVAAVLSVLLSTLTYGLRDYSRSKLGERLESRARYAWLEATVEHSSDLAVVTAVGRLLLNLVVILLVLHLLRGWLAGHGWSDWAEYGLALVIGGGIALVFSVLLPHALAANAGEAFVAACVKPLHAARLVLLPVLTVLHLTDGLVKRASNPGEGTEDERFEEEVEAEILSLAEEAEERGVVDEREREMLERVIAFHDGVAAHVMTARPRIVSVPVTATLGEVRDLLERTGHSRVPVYDGTLDHIEGILYARDLIHRVGRADEPFDLRSEGATRPPVVVPETKPLGDLLQDFRLQKVHIAVVQDEYGATSGLVTIEDLLEELVGEISDEHEPLAEAQFTRLDERSAEVDAKLHLDEVNRLLGLDLPDDEGYDTLGGFVSNHLGRIPAEGTTFTHDGATYVVLSAEPQRVNRLRIDLLEPANGEGRAGGTPSDGAAPEVGSAEPPADSSPA